MASLPDYRHPINQPRYPLVRKATLYLDDIAGFSVFFESEQSKNRAGEMVPLYAARVQDLGPDDVAVFKCGACGHTAELWPSLLIGGLGLQPTDKVLDLEGGVRVGRVLARRAGGGGANVEKERRS